MSQQSINLYIVTMCLCLFILALALFHQLLILEKRVDTLPPVTPPTIQTLYPNYPYPTINTNLKPTVGLPIDN